jgi:hypothetical protein
VLCRIFLGDMLIFAAGRFLGARPLRARRCAGSSRRRRRPNISRAFARNRAAIVFASRFTPGSRAAPQASRREPCGRIRRSSPLLFALAALLWTPLLVLATAELGRKVETLLHGLRDVGPAIFVAAALFALLCARTVAAPLHMAGSRRLLLSRGEGSRAGNMAHVGASGPVFFYVLYLGFIKLRRPTFFTVVNPGIAPDSGFIGESKDAIYRALSPARARRSCPG